MQAEHPVSSMRSAHYETGCAGSHPTIPMPPGREIFRDRAHPGLDASADPDGPLVRGDARRLACRTRPAPTLIFGLLSCPGEFPQLPGSGAVTVSNSTRGQVFWQTSL